HTMSDGRNHGSRARASAASSWVAMSSRCRCLSRRNIMPDLVSIRHDISNYRALLRTEFTDAGRRLISKLLLNARAEETLTESAAMLERDAAHQGPSTPPPQLSEPA